VPIINRVHRNVEVASILFDKFAKMIFQFRIVMPDVKYSITL